MIANSITGASTLFRRELLDDVLPFPRPPRPLPHDHWLGLVALALGEVAYVDEPLYDYVQHEGAVIGHADANRPRRPLIEHLREHLSRGGNSASAVYHHDWLQLLTYCEVLRLRCLGRMSASKRRALMRVLTADRRVTGLAWLLGRRVGAWGGRDATLGRELLFSYAIAGGRAPAVLALGRRRPGPFAPDAEVPPPPELSGLRAAPRREAPRG